MKKGARYLLNDRIPMRESVFFYISMAAVAIITVYPMSNTGLARGDDMASYIITRLGKVFSEAKQLAEIHGRVQYFIVVPVQCLPFIWDDMFAVKLFQILPAFLS